MAEPLINEAAQPIPVAAAYITEFPTPRFFKFEFKCPHQMHYSHVGPATDLGTSCILKDVILKITGSPD